MKSMYRIFIFLFTTGFCYGQVGINTDNPQKDLDVNGEVRVRDIPTDDVANSTGVVFVNAAGDFKKSKFSNFVRAETGIGEYTSQTSPNNWQNLVLGNKSTFVTFIGRNQADNDFMFTLFIDPSGGSSNTFKSIENANCTISNLTSTSFDVVVQGFTHKFTFSSSFGVNVSLTVSDGTGSTGGAVEGKIQTFSYP